MIMGYFISILGYFRVYSVLLFWATWLSRHFAEAPRSCMVLTYSPVKGLPYHDFRAYMFVTYSTWILRGSSNPIFFCAARNSALGQKNTLDLQNAKNNCSISQNRECRQYSSKIMDPILPILKFFWASKLLFWARWRSTTAFPNSDLLGGPG